VLSDYHLELFSFYLSSVKIGAGSEVSRREEEGGGRRRREEGV